MVKKIHHVGIVVENLARAYRFWRDALGLPLLREAEIADQGVRAALLAAGDGEIELLEPTDTQGGVARFLAKRGEGLHHVCFETPNVEGMLADLKAGGVQICIASGGMRSGCLFCARLRSRTRACARRCSRPATARSSSSSPRTRRAAWPGSSPSGAKGCITFASRRPTSRACSPTSKREAFRSVSLLAGCARVASSARG